MEPEIEQHYTAREVAQMTRYSYDTILRIFRDEPGVLSLGRAESAYGKKRAYESIRIPASVVTRVLSRMRKKATGNSTLSRLGISETIWDERLATQRCGRHTQFIQGSLREDVPHG